IRSPPGPVQAVTLPTLPNLPLCRWEGTERGAMLSASEILGRIAAVTGVEGEPAAESRNGGPPREDDLDRLPPARAVSLGRARPGDRAPAIVPPTPEEVRRLVGDLRAIVAELGWPELIVLGQRIGPGKDRWR